jgi:hypothetical protein
LFVNHVVSIVFCTHSFLFFRSLFYFVHIMHAFLFFSLRLLYFVFRILLVLFVYEKCLDILNIYFGVWIRLGMRK